MNRKSILLLCLLLASGHVFSQTTNADCMTLIRVYYNKMNNPPLSSTGTYHLSYTVQTHMRDSSNSPNTKSDVEMLVNNMRVYFYSREIQSYQDDQNAFTVIPGRKEIYRADPTLHLGKELRSQRLTMLQDTLLGMSQVVSCKDATTFYPQYDKVVELSLSSQAQTLFKVKKMTFYVSTKRESIYKIIIAYTDDKDMLSLDIVLSNVDYNFKTDKLNNPVASMFLNAKGELLPTYKGFQLIDARKEK